MSDISPIGSTNQAALNGSVGVNRTPTPTSPAGRGDDRVEFSDTARLLAQLKQVPEVREDLVNSIRSQIDRDIYESPEKLDTAIDRLLEEFA